MYQNLGFKQLSKRFLSYKYRLNWRQKVIKPKHEFLKLKKYYLNSPYQIWVINTYLCSKFIYQTISILYFGKYGREIRDIFPFSFHFNKIEINGRLRPRCTFISLCINLSKSVLGSRSLEPGLFRGSRSWSWAYFRGSWRWWKTGLVSNTDLQGGGIKLSAQ